MSLKQFFNTSGLKYEELGLKDKLTTIREDEQYALLAIDGILVKRPILVGTEKIFLGFKEKDWQEHFLQSKVPNNFVLNIGNCYTKGIY